MLRVGVCLLVVGIVSAQTCKNTPWSAGVCIPTQDGSACVFVQSREVSCDGCKTTDEMTRLCGNTTQSSPCTGCSASVPPPQGKTCTYSAWGGKSCDVDCTKSSSRSVQCGGCATQAEVAIACPLLLKDDPCESECTGFQSSYGYMWKMAAGSDGMMSQDEFRLYLAMLGLTYSEAEIASMWGRYVTTAGGAMSFANFKSFTASQESASVSKSDLINRVVTANAPPVALPPPPPVALPPPPMPSGSSGDSTIGLVNSAFTCVNGPWSEGWCAYAADGTTCERTQTRSVTCQGCATQEDVLANCAVKRTSACATCTQSSSTVVSGVATTVAGGKTCKYSDWNVGACNPTTCIKTSGRTVTCTGCTSEADVAASCDGVHKDEPCQSECQSAFLSSYGYMWQLAAGSDGSMSRAEFENFLTMIRVGQAPYTAAESDAMWAQFVAGGTGSMSSAQFETFVAAQLAGTTTSSLIQTLVGSKTASDSTGTGTGTCPCKCDNRPPTTAANCVMPDPSDVTLSCINPEYPEFGLSVSDNAWCKLKSATGCFPTDYLDSVMLVAKDGQTPLKDVVQERTFTDQYGNIRINLKKKGAGVLEVQDAITGEVVTSAPFESNSCAESGSSLWPLFLLLGAVLCGCIAGPALWYYNRQETASGKYDDFDSSYKLEEA